MIALLTGNLVESSFTECVIDVHGVGYEVQIPISTFDKLPQPGEQVTLLIRTQVREDAITLFGFATPEEKQLFGYVINVSGIGGKLALSILSAMPVVNFCSAIAAGDVKALSRIPGIGKRTAERLIVELRDKLGKGLAGKITVSDLHPEAANAVSDVALALEQLGYKREAIDRTLNALVLELKDEAQDSEKLLRAAIRKLSF